MRRLLWAGESWSGMLLLGYPWPARSFLSFTRSGSRGLWYGLSRCGLFRHGHVARSLCCLRSSDRRHDVENTLVITGWLIQIERRLWSYRKLHFFLVFLCKHAYISINGLLHFLHSFRTIGCIPGRANLSTKYAEYMCMRYMKRILYNCRKYKQRSKHGEIGSQRSDN